MLKAKHGEGKTMIEAFTFDQEISRMDLAKAIVLHEYPLSIVEHVGFRNFIGRLQLLFQMPKSRNTVESYILKLFSIERAKLFEVFDKVSGRISLTTDMWMSRQNKGYMVITAHFVDESWRLNNVILGFIYVPTPHKGDMMATHLMDCLLEWNIERKISAITVDNASNNNTMIHTLLEKLAPESFPLDGTLIHMRCAAHILNLIVKSGLKLVKTTLKFICDHISYWLATPSREEKFEKGCNDLKIPYAKKLALDCDTRWNSPYLMLETALGYKDVFYRMNIKEKLRIDLPSDQDWVFAREICGKLKLFYSITELFSGTENSTTNYLFPKICEIKLALRSWCTCGVSQIEEWANEMTTTFESYWGDSHLIGALATILDPRYKMKFIELVFEKIYYPGSTIEKTVEDTCKNLFFEYVKKYKSMNDVSYTTGSSSRVPSESTVDGEWDILSEYDLMVSNMSTENVKSELDLYLEENTFPRVPNFDVLNWWKANGAKYATLQLISRDILAVPVSTVASESAFIDVHTGLVVERDKENAPSPTDCSNEFKSMMHDEEYNN